MKSILNKKNNFKKIVYTILSFSAILLIPSNIIFAQNKPESFKNLVANIIDIFNTFIYLIMALVTFYFLAGVLRYLFQSGDEKARQESVKTISYGLVALFVMIAVWGLVAVLSNTLLGVREISIPQF